MARVTLLLIIIFLIISTSVALAQRAPALYVFGDSTVDPGNYYGHAPGYGDSYAKFIASYLGLPSVVSYHGIQSRNKTSITKTGINYGFFGTGILNQTFSNRGGGDITYWSFDKQIENFNYTVEVYLKHMFSSRPLLLDYLSKSIFLISFGINDFTVNFLPPSNVSLSHLKPERFADYLLKELATRLTTLHGLGARKFVVKSIWPLGCAPMFENVSDPLADLCNLTINEMLIPYRDRLGPKLKNLQHTLSNSTFSHTKDFEFVWDMKANGRKYGINNTKDPCIFNGTKCSDEYHHLYFDDLHTTAAANQVYALHCFNGTLCSPKNIIQLVGN